MIFIYIFNITVHSECDSGYFGKGCENLCGRCSNNDVCNHVDGFCPDSCSAGWKGPGCKDGKLTDF